MKLYEIFGLGNPLIDILINVDDNLVDFLQLKKNSMNLVTELTQKNILEVTQDLEKIVAVGGSCANTMVMFAQLGGKSAYSGKVSDDEFGAMFVNHLEKDHVKSFLKKEKNSFTGSTVILITPDSARTMNTHLGSSQTFSVDDIDYDAINQSEYLYIEGYLWDTDSQKQAVVSALEYAKQNDIKIIFSLSDPFCVQRHQEDFTKLLKDYADIMFCNEEEACTLTSENSATKAIEILNKFVSHFVITMGKEGALIYQENQTIKIPAIPVQPIDTTGAGDSFAAGYLFGLINHYPVEKSGTIAANCAAKIITQIGSRYHGDLKKEVLK